MVKANQPEGRFGRGLKLGKLGLSLTGSYLGYQVQNLLGDARGKEDRKQAFQRTASRKLREELQSLKGAVMKMGQALSMQTHLLSDEATAELAHLQMRAPPMHPTLARAQFKASMGRYPEEVFKEFNPEPLAAASLGQVHRAVMKDGRVVAVKIQYPAIRKAIENDFKLLRTAILPGRLSGHLPPEALTEIETGILRETSYLNEARNLRFFGRALAPLPYVKVPEPVTELSTDRVLTMSFMEGAPLDEWLQTHSSQRQRDLLGRRLGELFHYQFRRVRAVHSDPHPGNYLFDRDANIRLVDFGSVSFFTPRMSELVDCFTHRIWEEGESGMDRLSRSVCGGNAEKTPARARRAAALTIEFYNTVFSGGVVDFGDPKIMLTLAGLWKEFLRNKFVSPDLIFASRAEMGLYNLLHRLRAKVDTTAILEEVSHMPQYQGPPA